MRNIVDTLVSLGVLTDDEAGATAPHLSDRDALDALLASQRITEEQAAHATAVHTGHPHIDLMKAVIDPDAVALVPGALCRRHRLVPVRRERNRLVVAMIDPTDLRAIDDVASLTGLVVAPEITTPTALRFAFARHVRSDEEISELSSTMGEAADIAGLAAADGLEGDDAGAPVVRFVNLLISQAITDRASDIHVEPGERDLTVRYRIDGVLHEMQRADRSIQDGVISRLKIMASIDIADRRRPQDGRMSVPHEGRTVDLRVATLPTVWGEKITMRILDTSGQRIGLDELELSVQSRARLEEAIARPYGMVLATGPTGSGKSTTLYAALDAIARPEVSVVTVEDPVEYRVAGINQVQVNPRAGLTFASALRSILRIDPDIILVGEIRDHETAITSIEAALTGHLVFSTLHTNDAPSALTRLIEIGAEPYLVGSALTAVVGQRLTRRLCTACREPLPDRDEVLAGVGFPTGLWTEPTVFRPVGCPSCAGTGYRGRLALHEVMPVTEQIEHEALRGVPSSVLRQRALDEGMIPLRTDGWHKVAAGLTSVEEVLRVTV
ncbi:GspE/PulE family protein [Microbacterium sp. No. 7]|uniref:GspE/PulE family protein n=1 Tax=Microbacterium sp. No. 7 TaxID=1714373 RepID=UPI0006D2694E|nr:ATPase, T2SS/T4P/T4SS family [Microbacterium sp. No. 7]ALJ18748.1 type II secretion system protein GspE [Microbacterium sp. No. 7]